MENYETDCHTYNMLHELWLDKCINDLIDEWHEHSDDVFLSHYLRMTNEQYISYVRYNIMPLTTIDYIIERFGEFDVTKC